MASSRVTRPAAISMGFLLVWLALWLGTRDTDTPALSLLTIAFAWLPLAPALPLVWIGNRKAAGWTSMAGVIYAGFFVMELVANPAARWWAAVALALALVMITLQVRMIRGPASQGR
jgi:uncharacterized membrane protein